MKKEKTLISSFKAQKYFTVKDICIFLSFLFFFVSMTEWPTFSLSFLSIHEPVKHIYTQTHGDGRRLMVIVVGNGHVAERTCIFVWRVN